MPSSSKRVKSKSTPLPVLPKSAPASSTLLDTELHAESTASTRKQGSKKTLDDQVTKLFRDNFQSMGWPAESLDLVIRNDMSLRKYSQLLEFDF